MEKLSRANVYVQLREISLRKKYKLVALELERFFSFFPNDFFP